MKMRHLFLWLMTHSLLSCGPIHDEAPNAENGLTNQPNCDDGKNTISYQIVSEQVFAPHCIQCHSTNNASGGVDLSRLEASQSNASRAWTAVNRNSMPPSGPLNDELKNLLNSWVTAGAPNQPISTNCEQPVDPPPPADDRLAEVPPIGEINFDLVRDKIFKLSCFGCHSDAGGNVDGLNLERYGQVVDEIEDIEEEVFSNRMPPPPRPSLTDVEKETLDIWINRGTPR